MDFEATVLASVTAVAVAFTPGPNNVICASIGLSRGFRAALPYAFGVTVGFPLLLLFVGVGLGGLINAYPDIQIFVRIIGGLFLIYLAWQIATAAPKNLDADIDNEKSQKRPPGFVQAVLFQWINPKAVSFSLSLVGAFISPASFVFDLSVLMIITGIVSLASTLMWASIGVLISRFLQTPKRQRVFNGALGALLLITALFILFPAGE